MADGAVNFLLDKLATTLEQKVSQLGNSYSEIQAIKLELESIRSFIRVAERSMERNESIETWVRQVREVAFEVEDLVDEFIYYEEMQQEKKGLKHIVQDIINFPKHLNARQNISSKLQKLKVKVLQVSERSQRYAFDRKIDEGKGGNASIDWGQHYGESSIFGDEDEIVGTEENRKKLLKWLIEGSQRRTVISIVGMGGLGKTTLVTEVYNNPVIQRHFHCWAWISVSQKKGVEELLRSMAQELFRTAQEMIPSNLGSMDYRQLMETNINFLLQKRYVVILDDVWDIVLWTRIRGVFPNNNHGSRIIFTTRNENVASAVGPGSRVHRLSPLEKDDAWALFCKKAFWNRNCPLELKALAEAILRKCEGLPLAIVAIGGLMLSKNETAAEWKKVHDSLNWHLSNSPFLDRVKGILMISLNDLPFYLKHCFLYCCVFRDGYKIKRKKLIRLWVAEGFAIERKGITIEDVAEDYLTELIFRSMIQVTEINDAGRVKTFKVHDFVRELAVTTSEKENFSTTYDGGESRQEGKVQRLTIYNTGDNIRLSRSVSHHLRSLFVFETETSSPFPFCPVSSNFRLLKVLDLQGVFIEKIPGTLVGLFNLRYLNLRETKVSELPKSMERLRNLQTLDLRSTRMEKLPSGISNMANLRHLFHSGLRVPSGIGNLRSLQTLTCIEAEEGIIKELGNLTDLKRLDVTRLRTLDGPMLCNSIQKMTSLRRLSVMTSTEQEELQLEALALPPLFLQKLTLVGQLNRLPDWLGSLVNLTHLYLCSCLLEEDLISPIDTLPTLVYLELNKAYSGRLLHFKAGGFPKLNKLNLLELVQLNNLRLEEGALPSIRELYLVRCQELKTLPQGIEHLTSLQKLQFTEMPEEFVQSLRSARSEDHTKFFCGLIYFGRSLTPTIRCAGSFHFILGDPLGELGILSMNRACTIGFSIRFQLRHFVKQVGSLDIGQYKICYRRQSFDFVR